MHGLAGIRISETALRNLITVLIVLFLVTLGTALTLQLLVSRDHHLNAHNRQSVMHLKIAASELSAILGAGLASGTSHRVPDSEDLAAVLLPHAVEAGRIFAIMDGAGRIRATAPAESGLKGMRLAEIFAPDFLAAGPDGSEEMTETTLNDGQRAFVKMQSLAPYPGSLLVIHPRDAVLAAWRSDVAQIVTLFVVTLGVLVLLGAAFHWQAARAAEADRTLSVATERLDKALDRGRCGLWDWDIARGRIFWSKSMFDILGLEPQDEFLELRGGRRAHPSRRCRSSSVVEQMLRGGKPSIDQEFRMRHADGHWVWLRARCELVGGAGRAGAASRRHRHRHHRAEARRPAQPGGRDPAQGRDREDLGSLRAVGRRQPAGHLQLEIPAVPFAAGERLPAAARPMRSSPRPPRSRRSASACRSHGARARRGQYLRGAA